MYCVYISYISRALAKLMTSSIAMANCRADCEGPSEVLHSHLDLFLAFLFLSLLLSNAPLVLGTPELFPVVKCGVEAPPLSFPLPSSREPERP
jgi:hypothetical protein